MIVDAVKQTIARFMGANDSDFVDDEVQASDKPSEIDTSDPGYQFRKWLPYRTFMANEQVFKNTDSIGWCMEVLPQTGADMDMANSLKGLFSSLPTDACIQIALFAHPNIKDRLVQYATLRSEDSDISDRNLMQGRPTRNNNLGRVMARRRVEHLMKGAHGSLAKGASLMIRNFRCVLSVTLPGSTDDARRLGELLNIREQISATLTASSLTHQVMDASDLINWVADLCNPGRLIGGDRVTLQHDRMVELNQQMAFPDTYFDWRPKDRFELTQIGQEDRRFSVRTLSANKYPETNGLWEMGAIIGDMFETSLQVPCPFLVVMGCQVPDQSKEKSAAVTNAAKADADSKTDFAKLSPAMSEKAKEWQYALRAVTRGGKIVNAYHQVVLYAKPSQLNRATNAVREIWRKRNFELMIDGFMQRQGFLACMPMRLSQQFAAEMKAMSRMWPKTSGNATHLAPVIAEGKGSETPVLVGVGRRGQLVAFDFWDNRIGGKNVSVVGSTGSGKSTLLQEIAASYWAIGTKVRVFEKGRSFERLSHRANGSFIRFNSASRVCVNPFSMVTPPQMVDGEMCGGINDDVAMLQPVLAKMASPTQPLDPVVYATLATIIKEEYDKNPKMTVTDVYKRYKKGCLYEGEIPQQRFFDMAYMLAPFAKGGPYEQFFEGESTLDMSNNFVCFELEDLGNNQHLKGVIEMILLYQITQEMLMERTSRKMFIMDEAKDALAGNGPNDQAMSEFIEKLYLRIRKYHGSAVTATQNIEHYYASVAGASVFNQSDFIFLGRQSKQSISSAAKSEKFVMDDGLKRLLGSLAGEEGVYKEWYVQSPIYTGVFRLFIDPTTGLLLSNRAEDNVPIDTRLAAGMTMDQAIDDVLRERGVL
jgi:conjugal transfer ATP-binding protein TraC